ncbi:MAG TPA: ABC transporter ATP-binding protein [Candidatus Binatia bacterium]|nr:ABC transporter ATP-binding protein [Candidatus Binatia bacterium]
MATILTGLIGLGAATTIPLVMKAMIDGPITEGRPRDLLLPVVLTLGLAAVEFGGNFLRRNGASLMSVRLETELRNDFYAHLQALHVAFHDTWQSGQLLSRAVTDIQTIRRFLNMGIVFFGVLLAQWVAVLVMLLRLDWRLALVTAATVLPLLGVSRYFFRRYAGIARRMQDQQGDLTTVIEEMATGVRIVKAFGRDPLLLSRFLGEADRLRATNLEAVALRARTWIMFTLLPTLGLGVVLLLGGLAVMQGQLTIGSLVAFMTYLFMLIWPLDALGWILAMGEEATTASTRLAEVFDTQPVVRDRPGARAPDHAVEGRVTFEGVGFRFGDGPWVLRDLSVTVEPGETLAVVGATGSGKTTLLGLPPRLHDAVEGRVALDGVDVRDVQLRSLRALVGVAFEDPILFSASVYENLAMGRSHVPLQDIERALEVAQAGFVWELPYGLETRIGEQGHSLSGGQRQRLALARAVLSGPRVLVLDDPLSAVDVHTEREIESALRSVLGGVTALIVAHRPSTLALADRVALLEGGRVAAIGTHSELLRSSGRYRDLLASEAAPAEPGDAGSAPVARCAC